MNKIKVISSSDLMKYTICSYLENNDKINLHLCNKTLNLSIKNDVLIHLTTRNSLKYILDEKYRKKINNMYKREQLCLSLFYKDWDNVCMENYDIYENPKQHYVKKQLSDDFIINTFPSLVKFVEGEYNEDRTNMAGYIIECLFKENNYFSNKYNVLEILEGIHFLDLSRARINTASKIPNIHTVILTQSTIYDVSALHDKKINTLFLIGTKVEDVSCLGHIHKLDLSGTWVSDVSNLSNVHTLNLSETYVTDISKLCNNYNLNLSALDDNIESISSLQNVRYLNLTYTNININELSILKNVHTLDLSYNDVPDLSFLNKINVHTLILQYARFYKNISLLGKVHTLDLSCSYITNKDLKYLSNVRNLNLSFSNITDVSALGNVHTLNLRNTKITDVSALGNVHTLDLTDTKITDVSALGNVHTLILKNCKNVRDVSALSNVKHLDLSNTYIRKVSTLGNVYSLNLKNTNIYDVSKLSNVVELDISYNKIKDLSMLKQTQLKKKGTKIIKNIIDDMCTIC